MTLVTMLILIFSVFQLPSYALSFWPIKTVADVDVALDPRLTTAPTVDLTTATATQPSLTIVPDTTTSVAPNNNQNSTDIQPASTSQLTIRNSPATTHISVASASNAGSRIIIPKALSGYDANNLYTAPQNPSQAILNTLSTGSKIALFAGVLCLIGTLVLWLSNPLVPVLADDEAAL